MMSRTSFLNHIVARGIFYAQSLCQNIYIFNHKCFWCKKEVRVSGSSLSNILTHRDGSCQTGRLSDGCSQFQKAIDKGAKLPATSLQEIKNKNKTKDGLISSHFNQAEKFDRKTLNNILSLWLLRQAIPWTHIEDPYLRAAFHYCEPGAELFKQKWAASHAPSLRSYQYSKFTLIHDVWTTKGNRFVFICASVSFIDNDWNYVVKHLSLKLVAWNHKGILLAEPIVNVLAKHDLQRKICIHSTLFTKHSSKIADLYYDIYLFFQTTDSGSNNNTMSKTIHHQLSDLEGLELPWDYDTMHLKCFCCKM
ncbi:hypothetical protein VP01_5787g2 [Puccinia sorghi]|uniref:Uncharacterized protein n=1 Tax=Puccinia sorghi TaxID=27349 RepID=A0A0L6UKC6_9BASI|nr:hypothetical protein VP01_5787g2 [Puccinia sorghi]